MTNQARYGLIFAKDKMDNRRNGLTLKHCADLWSLEELREMNWNALQALKLEAAR